MEFSYEHSLRLGDRSPNLQPLFHIEPAFLAREPARLSTQGDNYSHNNRRNRPQRQIWPVVDIEGLTAIGNNQNRIPPILLTPACFPRSIPFAAPR